MEIIEKAYFDDVIIKGEAIPINCGNGVCEEELGEDEETCPQDCSISPNIQSYYDFMDRHPELWQEITESELNTQIDETRQALDDGEFLLSVNIEQTIKESLNIESLIDGIETRPPEVSLISTTESESYLQKELILSDPEIGEFKALLLIPTTGSAPYPAVVGLHGHGDFAETFRDEYFGARLAEEGFAVIMPTFRAMSCDAEEEEPVATDMLLKGFSLMGMRVYEAHLLSHYLKQEGISEAGKIGLIGHSGGSSTSNLAVRISNQFDAEIFDLESDYLNLCEGKIHCETIPELALYSQQINNHTTLSIPSLQFEYGYPEPDAETEIITFFRENLMTKK